ncbi:HlyD family secretion protein [Marinoscillum sp. 108]|uniref:HlyD family secretion protein n=1 Tax=Marinoscillum sp. 108 TaxID=2653151 RepID=UPI0012EEED20|nr:HlyD family efflux transporter periplasmic adaptor subunit [Marinoscillum sp. 108]VXD17164.1 Biotin attachment protein [Marinoscillum sp. 108]
MLNITDDKIDDMLEEGDFYSLHTLKTPGMGRLLAKVSLTLVVSACLFLFLPWQQNIRGSGKVTALNPQNRPQTIESAISGRIKVWKISEGQHVTQGDTILTLSEVKDKYFDPNLLTRLSQQLEAKEQGLAAKMSKKEALERQIIALQETRAIKLRQARNYFQQSILKLEIDSIAFESEKIQFANSENTFDRNQKRYQAGNITLTKFQEIESKFQASKAKLISAENKWLQSKTELINYRISIAGTEAEYQDKISKAQSTVSETLADIHATEGEIAKIKNEFSNMEIRNQQYQIIAPQTGYIVRALKAGIGETIKEGEAVATIIPDSDDLAAEMHVRAMDLPFISTGRKVRIEFDGWPSLQFSGWPNASVGTFGGIVSVIDRVDSKPGSFRILVAPDPDTEAWPEQIRMGSGIKGWVMLNDVPIWFELWRQLNGFPPSIYENQQTTTNTSKK